MNAIVLEGRIARGLSAHRHLVLNFESSLELDSHEKLQALHAKIAASLLDDGTKTKKGLVIPFAAPKKQADVKVRGPFSDASFVVKVPVTLNGVLPDEGTLVRVLAKPRTYKFEKDKVLSIGWCLDLKQIHKLT